MANEANPTPTVVAPATSTRPAWAPREEPRPAAPPRNERPAETSPSNPRHYPGQSLDKTLRGHGARNPADATYNGPIRSPQVPVPAKDVRR